MRTERGLPVAAVLVLGALAVGLSLALPSSGANATSPDDAPRPWLETQKLTPEDADEDGELGNPSHWGVHFGSKIALDGDTLAIGTQFGSGDTGGSHSDGYDWAYIFTRDAQEWTQQAKLIPSDAHQGDSFAYSVALDEDSGVLAAGNPAAQKIHIFEQDAAGGWEETQTFQEDEVRIFGHDVAVDGDRLAAAGDGEVHLYERDSRGWNLTGVVENAATPVDLEEDLLVVRSTPNNRMLDVYQDNGGGWIQTTELVPPDHDPNGDPILGTVDLREDKTAIAVGASTDNRLLGGLPRGAEASATGSAWIYERTHEAWSLAEEIPNPDPHPDEGFGTSVSLSGDRVAIGAPRDLHNGAERAGAVYVYQNTTVGWALASKLANSDGGPYGGGDWLGESVGLDGDTLVAGAPFDDNRRDGTPPPFDDDGDAPACLGQRPMLACDEGEFAGSAYVFDTASLIGLSAK